MILAGSVRVGGRVVTKAGSRFSADEQLSVKQESRYISRAGAKLAGALDFFGIEITGRVCLDAGCSTGGFTGVLLERGAERVMAVDVGYGQLDWSLRNDPRVAVMERTNVRHLSGRDLPYAPDLLVADLSFISLSVALEKIFSTAPALQEAVLLVKPQFEAGPDRVGRGGVVRDPEIHAEVIARVAEFFDGMSFGATGMMRAPVVGRRSGNQEYPLHLVRGGPTMLDQEHIRKVVEVG